MSKVKALAAFLEGIEDIGGVTEDMLIRHGFSLNVQDEAVTRGLALRLAFRTCVRGQHNTPLVVRRLFDAKRPLPVHSK
jgi:hypothetical protein